ncbi:MAG: DUF493 domain-containing protein [Campylobacteraceae bacterium]|jgi:putative lipoic acid-binding regulatory protein|nr:DUF493 domain-containing protein [Campylobacteraceae bacterium]
MANISDNVESKELILSYPCMWTYKLIATQDMDMKKTLTHILKNKQYSLDDSKTSKKGAYKSYSLKLEVESDEERKEIFERLQREQNIKFIL